MFILGNFVEVIARILHIAITVYIWVIIIRALMSWFNPNPYHPVIRFIIRITDPVLTRVRQFLPDLGGLDISPIIILIILYFLDNFLFKTLLQLAYNLH